MKNKTRARAQAIMLVLLFVSFLAGIHITEAQDTPRVYLNPTSTSTLPEKSFSVDIVLEDVSNLVGWEFKLFWNNSLLECVTDIVHIPTGWDNHVEIGPGIEQDYAPSQSRYFRGLAAIPTQENYTESFSGNTTLVTLTFNVKAEGSCVLDLADTKLVDSVGSSIDHAAENGYVESKPTEKTLYLRICAAIALAFGTTLEDPMWKPFADLNIDGIIDIYDMVLVTGAIAETA